MKKLIRDNVINMSCYEPGLPLEAIEKELTGTVEIHKLASNENPLGPSPLAVQAVKEALKNGHLYPDNTCGQLRKRVAQHLNVSEDRVWIGNGTTELIYLLGVVFLNPGDKIVTSKCSFIMAKMVAQVMNSCLIEVPLKGYRHDFTAMLKEISMGAKMVYVDNPMNPIGTRITKPEVEEFMGQVPEDVIVVFDEAYYEYATKDDFPDTIRFIEQGRNVIVLRTFSKLYGLAGFRVGYCAAKEEFVQALQRVSPPFAVNRFAQIGAAAALEDRTHVQKTREINASGKELLYESFAAMSLFYIPSETNFVTVDVKADAKKVCGRLLEKGMVVRPLTMYGLPTFIRVTVGTPKQNKKFIEAFKEVCSVVD